MFAHSLGRAQAKAGLHIRMAHLYPPDPHQATLPISDFDVELAGDLLSPLERGFGFHPRVLARLIALSRAFRPSIVQANGARSLKYAALLAWALPGRFAVVYRNIGDVSAWLTGLRHRAFYRSVVFPKVDVALGVAQSTLKRALPYLRPDAGERSCVVKQGVDEESLIATTKASEVRHELGIGDDQVVVLYLGSLTPEKRPDRFVRAVRRARSLGASNLIGLMVGGGPQLRAFVGDAECIAIGPRNDPGTYLHAVQMLGLTSDTEGLPGVCIEAAWLGLPVVATDVGGVRECVEDGVTGFVVPADDEELFARRLVALASSEAARHELGTRAAATIRLRFPSIDIVEKQYRACYIALLADTGRAG